MAGPRKPKNLDEYIPRSDMADWFELLAKNIRSGMGGGAPMMKCNIQFYYWNPLWEKPPKRKPKA